MKVLALVIALALAALAIPPANAQADMTGSWRADFFGNKVECHLEQRGQYLYGVAYVTATNGERNTYHMAGVVLDDGRIRAAHGSGNYFDGKLTGADSVSGTFYFVNKGHSFSMQAERVAHGKTAPGGLKWPDGFPPSQ